MNTLNATQQRRRDRLQLLAKANEAELDGLLAKVDPEPGYVWIRPAEIGLTMVRARAGGTGQRFNLGETTVTRCSVRLQNGREGHAYILGRHKRRAEKAALIDACLQGDADVPEPARTALDQIASRLHEGVAAVAAKAATTRVDFFTMVRGE